MTARLALPAMLALVSVRDVPAQTAQTKKLPNIIILATGGTIAGAAATGAQAGYTSGQVSIDSMIQAVPGIRELANLKGEQVANVGSQDMTFEVMLAVAKRCNQVLANPEVDGVVITHGTDTMEETAFFLNLTVKSDKPVVMTGSMRPSTAISADGPLNLYNAVAVAGDPLAKGRGVLVVMNDFIHGAHSLTKTSTTAVQTFQSPLRGLVGIVAYGKSDWFSIPHWKHTTGSEFDISSVTKLPRVDILYAYADMTPDLIDCSVKDGARGIVFAGVGNGNLNKASLDAAARASKSGVAIVRASRVPTGSVGRNVEVKDDELGFVASDELNPPKARILLALALLKQRTLSDIQKLFYTY
jgi:L-asparaginase